MVTLSAPLRRDVQLRKVIPTSFLKDAAVNAFDMLLRTTVGEKEDYWERAVRTISKTTITYERRLPATWFMQAVSLLDHCCTRHISPEATSFLTHQGLILAGPNRAYNMLVARAQHETGRKATERVMDNLQTTIQEERKPQTNQQ